MLRSRLSTIVTTLILLTTLLLSPLPVMAEAEGGSDFYDAAETAEEVSGGVTAGNSAVYNEEPDLEDDEDADNQPTNPEDQNDQTALPSEFGAPEITRTVNGNQLILAWDVVPEAEGYLVKVWTTGEEPSDEEAISTTEGTYSITLGTENAVFYRVAAVRAGEYAWSEPGQYTAPVFSAPVISQVKLKYGSTDNGVILSWSMTNKKGVVSYEILQGTSTKVNSMKKIGTVKAGKSSYEHLQSTAGTFYYAVKAIADTGEYRISNTSSKIAVKNSCILANKGLTWYGKTKSKVNLVKSAGSKTKVATIAKGTKVTAIGKYPSKVAKFHQPTWVKVNAGGKTGWLKYSQLSGGVKASINITKDYTRSVKENYVNSKGYTSKTRYLTWLCTYTQRVYTFKGSKGNWKLVHTDRVTSGRFSHPTPGISEARRSAKRGQIYRRSGKVFMVTEQGRRYYFKNASYFAPGIAYHTGTWWADTGKKRGSVASKPGTFGCIRMYDSGAAYIYKLPMHTSVIVTNKA